MQRVGSNNNITVGYSLGCKGLGIEFSTSFSRVIVWHLLNPYNPTQSKRMRVIYMGTPTLSVSPLALLLEKEYQVVGVYTQPDRPTGRGRGLFASPVKSYAEERGLKVLQPTSLGSYHAYNEFRSLNPDLVVVAAYGKILPKRLVGLPFFGCINIHPSLLPRHRGPSPVPFTLLEGDNVAGVTLMLLDEGMDTGPIIAQKEESIFPEDTGPTLSSRLFAEGAKLLVESLPLYLKGVIVPRPQTESGITYARKLTKEDGRIRWESSAESIWRHVRAYSIWPGSHTFWGGKLLKVLEAVPLEGGEGISPGEVVILQNGPSVALGVATGDGILGLKRVQLEGRRAVEAGDFLQGHEEFRTAMLPS